MIEIKIGRHKYEITEEDMFMDNGACVQLLTQSREKSTWGRKPSPILSKKLTKEIYKMNRIARPHKYGKGVNIFSIKG